MRIVNDQVAEMRLVIHPYPDHTTVALVTRNRSGSENWDRRQHAWDLPLPQRDYAAFDAADQLWVVLGALAASIKPRPKAARAKPPEPPDGGYRGEQEPLTELELDLDSWATIKSGQRPSERSGA